MALAEHLEKLRHFQRLVSFKSIREGSQSMGISQAGLSKSIASLEGALGTPLFLRSRDGLTLTKEGEEVLKSAERILHEATNLETKLRTLKASSAPSRLQIGMYDSIAVYFYAELTAYLETLYPDVDLELTVDTSGTLAKEVSDGHLDLAVGVNLDRQAKPSLEFFKLFDDRYSFYSSARHELETSKLPLLIHARAEDSNGISVERHLKAVINKRGAHRVFNFETLKTLTTQGLGIGVMPTQVAKPLVKKGALINAEIPRTKHFFGPHNIGFLATRMFLKSHRDFAEDIYRLGDRWFKN